MTTSNWSLDFRKAIASWLGNTLTPDHVESMIPEGDPLRMWWEPEPRETAVSRLAAILCGGADHLTLLALVQRARVIAAPPLEVEERISRELEGIALGARSTVLASDAQPETFLSYAHEDMERATAIGRLLGLQGIRLFRDVERIRPGESITTRLHQVLSMVNSAVVIVSGASHESEWVDRELRQLLARREDGGLTVLPVLVDDVPLPESIADVFTIDLRGYRGAEDDGWAHPRLQPLILRLRSLAAPLTGGPAAAPPAPAWRPMRFEVKTSRRILDDVFHVDESLVSYERFDGTMSRPLRYLTFVRGDSVAAILVNRRRGTVILTRQFRYPTTGNTSGWMIETVAGMLQAGESPEAGMRREIEEETGYRIGALTRISTFFVSPGGSSERVILFQADVDESDKVSESGGLMAEGEDIEIVSLTFAEARAMVASGAIADAKTIIGLQWLFAASTGGGSGEP